MLKVFEIYLYICASIVSIMIIALLIALTLNIICYFYQTSVRFNTFRKFLKKYNAEMQKEKIQKKEKL